MDEKLDNGSIIARKFVESNTWDTSFTIYNKVLEVEIELLDQNFESIIFGTYQRITPEGSGNLFSKSDFNNLCKIDLNEIGSFRLFYDRLRALSHGDYKNAYYLDEVSGKKVYIKIDTEI
jgi:methionyl-tRNA formyltransferase